MRNYKADFAGDLCAEEYGTGRRFWLDAGTESVYMRTADGGSVNVWRSDG